MGAFLGYTPILFRFPTPSQGQDGIDEYTAEFPHPRDPQPFLKKCARLEQDVVRGDERRAGWRFLVDTYSTDRANVNVSPGHSFPLGATPVDGGVNFSVWSRDATAVEQSALPVAGQQWHGRRGNFR